MERLLRKTLHFFAIDLDLFTARGIIKNIEIIKPQYY